MRMLHVKGWGWLEGDTKFKPESPAKFKPSRSFVHYSQSQYNLCGIVTHIGGIMEKGHYISEGKYGSTWFKCNDSTITETSYHNLSKCGYGFKFEQD